MTARDHLNAVILSFAVEYIDSRLLCLKTASVDHLWQEIFSIVPFLPVGASASVPLCMVQYCLFRRYG